MEQLNRMGGYLWYEAVEQHWMSEKNQDLYIGVVQKLRRDDGIKCEDPDDEETNVLIKAKELAYKDAVKRKPGEEGPVRAGDQAPREPTVSKGFGKTR